MAISYVGANIAEAATVTIPTGHAVGDVLLIFAFRDGSATNPTVPTGWNTITNTLDNSTLASCSIGWKRATSTSETSGTWTNATLCIVGVYRNAENSVDSTSPFGTLTSQIGTTSPSTYGAVSTMKGETSFLIAIQGNTAINCTTINTAPTSLTHRTSITAGTTNNGAIFDSGNAYEGTSYASNTVAPGATGNWITVVLELRPSKMDFANYQTGFVSSGLSVTEKVR